MRLVVTNIEYQKDKPIKIPDKVSVGLSGNPYELSGVLVHFPLTSWVDNFISKVASVNFDSPTINPLVELEATLDYGNFLKLEKVLEKVLEYVADPSLQFYSNPNTTPLEDEHW